MHDVAFKREQLITVSKALDIAEDRTGNYFKYSAVQWHRNRYDLKTLSGLTPEQIIPDAFAFVDKGVRNPREVESPRANRECYFICLQDHEILKALERDKDIELLPLLVYIFTHELVHIVRFGRFLQRFETTGADRKKEETVVHGITHDILKKSSLPRLNLVLASYRCHTPWESMTCQEKTTR